MPSPLSWTLGLVTWSVFFSADLACHRFLPYQWACLLDPYPQVGAQTEGEPCLPPTPTPEGKCKSQAALCLALTFPPETLVALVCSSRITGQRESWAGACETRG